MSVTLPDGAKQLVDEGKNFATMVTINPDGSPQATILWVTRDGDDLLLSGTTTRQKTKNLAKDDRVSVVIPKPNPQEGGLEVRGTASVTDEGGRELINRLYRKYIGEGDYPWDEPGTVRVVYRVTPKKVIFN